MMRLLPMVLEILSFLLDCDSKNATAGTTVIEKHAVPILQATPNSVILTPCLIKLRTVVVSSGMRLPIATTIPVMSLLRWYRFEIFINDGMRNNSAMRASNIRI